MNETMVTVVGNVATAPVFRELPSGSVARFRIAATARYLNRETGLWNDGHTNFFTVWAWRSLGTNVAASLAVGEPVIVQGKLRVRNEERGGGQQQWMSADIDAVAVGHDLSRGTTAFRRSTRTDGAAVETRPARSGAAGPQPVDDGWPAVRDDDRPPVQWEQPPEQGQHSADGSSAPAERSSYEGGAVARKKGRERPKVTQQTARPAVVT